MRCGMIFGSYAAQNHWPVYIMNMLRIIIIIIIIVYFCFDTSKLFKRITVFL